MVGRSVITKIIRQQGALQAGSASSAAQTTPAAKAPAGITGGPAAGWTTAEAAKTRAATTAAGTIGGTTGGRTTAEATTTRAATTAAGATGLSHTNEDIVERKRWTVGTAGGTTTAGTQD